MKSIEWGAFKALAQAGLVKDLKIIASPAGFSLESARHGVLFTKRGERRYWASLNNLLRALHESGIDRFALEGLQSWQASKGKTED
ncbi:hypothetical protein JFK97_19125 [Chromobacterium phragmitis]|uniref:hypothetical protein n=1 Tax=Chromobacterium amazonense TaxID=1382803 RepID=UPI0021B70B25|nr:hypothetical protein [Chromobacterium amazonense]MBM2886506.1 hypothetical protein [Chromobacterium amazonense]